MLKQYKWTLIVLAAFASLAVGSAGCGRAPDSGLQQAGTPDPGVAPTPGPTPSGITPPSTPPNYSYHFAVTGTGLATQVGGGGLQAVTDTSLIVSVSAGSGMPLSGTGFTVGFDCELFTVKVGSLSQTAFVKKQGYTDVPLINHWMSYDPCQSAQTTWAGDFSSALAPGHQTVNISISGAQYDNCRLYNFGSFFGIYYGGCGMSSVYSTHQVDGFANVYTN